MQAPGRIKGSAIRGFLLWYERAHAERLAQAVAAIPPALGGELDLDRPALGILPSTWYSMELAHAVLDELVRDLSPSELDGLGTAGGEATVASMMHGVYRFLFTQVLSPARYGHVVGLLWKFSYDTGKVTNRELGPNRHQGIVSGWAGHHPLLCRMNIAAKRAMYVQMGGKNVIVETRSCITDGATSCGSIIRWDR